MGTRRPWLPAAVLGLLGVRVLAAMLIPAVRQPGWPDVLVAVVATAAGVVLLVTGPPRPPRLAAAAAVAAFWLAPCWSALLHDQAVPVVSVALAAVAVVLVVGPPLSPLAFRTGIVVGSVIVVLSLLVGLVSATGLTDAGFHRVGDYQRAVLGVPALQGITLHPNTLGQLAAVTLVMSLAVALANPRLGAWVIPALATTALVWSQSRSGVVGAVAALAALLVVRHWDDARRLLIVAGLVLSVLPPLVTGILGRWIDVEGLVTGRQLAWSPAWRLFWESPLTGYGPDALNRTFWQTQPAQWWEPLHAHNQLLESAAQAGLVGVVALAAVTAAGVLPALRRAGDNGQLAVALVVLVGVTAGAEVPLGLTYFPISTLLPALVVASIAYAGPLHWQGRDAPSAPPAGDRQRPRLA